MKFTELFPGGPRMLTETKAYPLGADSVLLASFADTSGAKRVLDLGCGSGAISLLLAFDDPALRVDGAEIDPAAADEARANAAESGLAGRINIMTCDLRSLRETDTGGRYDAVVSNPPYFPVGGGKTSPSARRSSARSEETCTLSDLVSAAARLTKNGGKFFFVYRPERLSEAFCALSAAGLEPKRLRLVQARTDAAPSMALVECRLGGGAGLKIEPALILKDGNGADTEEVRRIYRMA